jgi:uncharacterized membrane protein (UPF0127 family)
MMEGVKELLRERRVAPWRAAMLVLALAMVASACSHGPPSAPESLPVGTLSIQAARGTVSMDVQIAETERARRVGLMGRRALSPAAGMAFLFDRPTHGTFWMKGMLIPLSIAFWAPDGTVASLLDMTPCRADPCHMYSPGVTYVGAVEANRGFFAAHGVEMGDRVVLTR